MIEDQANMTDSVKTVENEATAAKYWHDMYVATSQKAQDYAAKVGADMERLENELQVSDQSGYEKGFVDGAQHQMKSSVDKAVNRMAQPEQNQFKPDWNTEVVLVEEMQRMAKQFAEMQDWEVVASDQAMTIAMMKCEQEPVEYQYRTRPDWIPEWNRWNTCSKDSADAYEKNPYLHDWHYEVRTLYAAPPKREWVGLTDDDVDEICKAADDTASALIMAEDLLMEKSMTKIGCVNHDCAECQKPKREWVGLTDDEIKAIVGPWGSTEIKGYTRTLFDQIEAKLKEKNT